MVSRSRRKSNRILEHLNRHSDRMAFTGAMICSDSFGMVSFFETPTWHKLYNRFVLIKTQSLFNLRIKSLTTNYLMKNLPKLLVDPLFPKAPYVAPNFQTFFEQTFFSNFFL